MEHRFTVSATAYLRNLTSADLRDECFAVHFQEPAKDLGDGRKSMSMKAPVLIVSFWMAEQEAIAAKVARILNAHWDDPAFDAEVPCTMGVGCDESGVCYAQAHGEPDQCPRRASQ